MNVHFSYRLPKFPAVEKDVQRHIEKLQKRLKVFRPELVHLKGVVEQASPRAEITVSLNLRLPSGQMAAHAKAPTPTSAVKAAFEELLQQLKKHKDILRASHKWNRDRRGNSARPGSTVPEVPFEQTLAAVAAPTISSDDVRSYVNINLARLNRFVEREIYIREVQSVLAVDSVSKEEVVDEAIAATLSEGYERPQKLALEPWLYHQALRALDRLSRADEVGSNVVHLEDSTRRQNVKASDEPELQFHQPDESMIGETVIADDRIATPEQIMASDELLRLIASALRDLGSGPREAFILHALEGFTVDEIAGITGVPTDSVLASVSAARDHLRKAPALSRQFKGRFAPTGAA